MIVIEGMDNSGKSTLAVALAEFLGKPWRIQESEGPPQSREEMVDRLRRYDAMKATIFVRHPAVSNLIYDIVREPDRRGAVTADDAEAFYSRKPFLVYCDPCDRGLTDHVEKAHDSVEHLQLIERRYASLLGEYRHWAMYKADMIYRIGMDMHPMCFVINYLALGRHARR